MKWVIYVPREFGRTYLNGMALDLSTNGSMQVCSTVQIRYLYKYGSILSDKYSKLYKLLIKANSMNFDRLYMYNIFKTY